MSENEIMMTTHSIQFIEIRKCPSFFMVNSLGVKFFILGCKEPELQARAVDSSTSEASTSVDRHIILDGNHMSDVNFPFE